MWTCLLFLAAVCSLSAQEFTGRVTDPTGAVVPKVVVTAHNVDTGVDVKTTTNGSGSYTIPYLHYGNYVVLAEKDGFKEAIRTGINLHVYETSVVNFSLQVGKATETIVVNADTLLDNGKADVGEVVENTRVTELPLNGRDPQLLADLVAGESNSYQYGYHRPFDDNVQYTSVNGGGSGNIEMLLDGTPNESSPINITGGTTEKIAHNAYVAPVDSVQEFKMITSPYDAQYGLMAGAVEDVILKSGTNAIHGDAYEYARRTWLDANSWENDFAISHLKAGVNPADEGLETAKMKWDQFGFELDGPIVVPKIYNGKNKSFFTVQWEHFKQAAPVTDIESVPDPAWTGSDGNGGGNFSNLTYYESWTGQYVPKQIYDPATTTLSGGQYVRTQFANNQIPSSQLDKMAMAILKMYPKPNLNTAGQNTWSSNYALSTAGHDVYNNILLKWDEYFSSKDRFSLRYGYWMRNTTYNGNGMPSPLSTGYWPEVARSHTFAVEETHTFSPKLLFDFKSSVNVRDDLLREGSYFDPTTIGWSKSTVAQLGTAAATEMPEIMFFGGDGTTIGTNSNNEAIKNSLNVFPMVTWIKGSHTIHAGLDARFWQNGYALLGGGALFYQWGNWTYATANHSTYSFLDGNDIADFALGLPNGGQNQIWPQTYQSQHYWAPFIQDDWKVSKKLTLNIGARWDFAPSLVTRRDIGNYAFDTSSYNPVNSTALSASLSALGVGSLFGGETFLGVNGNPRSIYKTQKLNIQPRIGFAYSLNNKTVIRGGFGESMRTPQNGPGVDGFSAYTSYVSSDYSKGSSNGGVYPQYQNKLETPFASNGVNQPIGATHGLETNLGDGHSFINPSYQTPSFWSYSLGFERQFSPSDTVNVSYVGSRLYNGDSSANINSQGDMSLRESCNPENGGKPQYCGDPASDGKNNYNNVSNPFYQNSAFDTGTARYYQSYINKLDLTRPMPHFGDVTENLLNQSRTWYNSLQVTAMHRVSNALTLHGTWTWSKSMDAGGWTDQNYQIQARNMDTGDVTHRITLSGIFTLPVGRGHLLLPNANRIVDAAIGGWQLSGMSRIESGTPITVSNYYLHSPKVKRHMEAGHEYNTYVRVFAACAERYVRNDSESSNKDDDSAWSIAKYNDLSDPIMGSSNTTYDYTGTCPNGSDFRDVPSYAPGQRTTYIGMRNPGNKSFDVSMSKDFELVKNMKLQVRADAFNVLNHPEWTGGPDTSTGDATFGIMTKSSSVSNSARIGQLSAKIVW
jgi:hypothetical protein